MACNHAELWPDWWLHRLCIAAVVTALVIVAPVFTSFAQSVPGITAEVLAIPGDPPGDTHRAPGGGRVLTPAILFTPAAGENIHGPAIVLLSEGPGSNPARADEPSRYAAEKLAAQGYTVLSLYTHMERGFPLMSIEDTGPQVDQALTFLEMRGYEDIVLGGRGYGAIAAANYLANFPDTLMDNGGERRVKAALLLAPLTELRQYPRADLAGKDYADRVARAEASVASGRGLVPRGKTLEPGAGVGGQSDPWVVSGAYVLPAETFLGYFGPKAADRNLDLLRKLPVPTLALAPGNAPTVSVSVLKDVAKQAPITVKTYAGADAAFAGAQDQVLADIGGWLSAQGLGVRPRVQTRFVDLTAKDGSRLTAALYEPAGGADPSKPALVMIHGRTGDVLYASTHWMGWRMAQAGYAVLTPALRISGNVGFQTSSFAEVTQDIGDWIDRFAELGQRRVILTGHSNGGVWISNYMADRDDARVLGMIYAAPTLDTPTYAKVQAGEAAYTQLLEQARQTIARGEERRQVIGLMTVHTWYDTSAPDSPGMHTERVKQFARPGLSIIGRKDPLFQGNDFAAIFKANYRGPLDMLWYEDGTHGFRENKDRICADMAAWIRRNWP